jgi:hypothetical protein
MDCSNVWACTYGRWSEGEVTNYILDMTYKKSHTIHSCHCLRRTTYQCQHATPSILGF